MTSLVEPNLPESLRPPLSETWAGHVACLTLSLLICEMEGTRGGGWENQLPSEDSS